MKITFSMVIVLVLGALLVHADGPSTFQKGLPSKPLAFGTFVPSPVGPSSDEKRPLIVAIHGCQQFAADLASGTDLNILAEREKAFVLYPEQVQANNGIGCWNWFRPENQKRDAAGEMTQILNVIDDFTASHSDRIDLNRVFVVGISSGAAMANALISCFPERFAGGAFVAGLPFGVAQNQAEAFRLMAGRLQFDPQESGRKAFACGQNQQKTVPVLIIHGAKDETVVPANADATEVQYLKLADLTDDGQENNSHSWLKKEECIGGMKAFCMTSHWSADQLLIKKIIIPDVGHAWSGTRGLLPFTDTHGPSATQQMWLFFSSTRSSR